MAWQRVKRLEFHTQTENQPLHLVNGVQVYNEALLGHASLTWFTCSKKEIITPIQNAQHA
jgi:hypothetical protein